MFKRHDVDLGCRVQAAGMTQAGRITEISDGGARLTGVTDLHIGTSGMLQIDGVRSAIPFVQLGAEDSNVRISVKLTGRCPYCVMAGLGPVTHDFAPSSTASRGWPAQGRP
jgi:hypothetical protein